MWPNPQFPADVVTFTEEILNGKLHFLSNVNYLMSSFFHSLFCCTLPSEQEHVESSIKIFIPKVNKKETWEWFYIFGQSLCICLLIYFQPTFPFPFEQANVGSITCRFWPCFCLILFVCRFYIQSRQMQGQSSQHLLVKSQQWKY